jgi:hypothetical protein
VSLLCAASAALNTGTLCVVQIRLIRQTPFQTNIWFIILFSWRHTSYAKFIYQFLLSLLANDDRLQIHSKYLLPQMPFTINLSKLWLSIGT